MYITIYSLCLNETVEIGSHKLPQLRTFILVESLQFNTGIRLGLEACNSATEQGVHSFNDLRFFDFCAVAGRLAAAGWLGELFVLWLSVDSIRPR